MTVGEAQIGMQVVQEDGEKVLYVQRRLVVLNAHEAATLAKRLEAVIDRFMARGTGA